ncbi:pentatricopeptide repeat-containing protein At3g09040, mitochondrial [Selaginella moellendorffii]|uniref:pentatricopeptide repeat-containing protein At3g09040, mitochondrial n=1 Tax=Selaginella moellendorffii TaxID=88036 RepID=UPI000D1CCE79|nr:pentatricopeptide repeat-containing protein At3g09040, mitochondrial [Selaginella moellendorffii]|eukprot:XP_024538470.1 pentatricopeptide repeat-containing protein At3g09040, mitochondrial [Selaginella moellendorffii]
MYASCGSVEDAKAAFERIRPRNVFSWNIMLSAYAQKGHLREARELFDKMEKRDVVSWTTLLSGYAQMGYVDEARGLFDRMKQHSGVSWSSMVSAYAQNGYPSEALEIFWAMSLEGVKPRTSTWVSVIDSCGSALAVKDGEVLRQAVKDAGLEGDVVVGTALVDMLGKFGKPEEAWRVFAGISEKNTISWNAIMSAFARNDRFQEALRVFQTMCLEGAEQDNVTFLNVFSVCSKAPTLAFEGECWYQRLLEAGFAFDCSLETAVVNMCVNSRRLEQAFRVFDGMIRRSTVTWTIVLRACGQSGDARKALKMLALMDQDGIPPDKIVILSVLESCSSSLSFGSVQRVIELHRDVVEGTSFHSDSKVGTALIMLYSRCGSLEHAKASFDGIVRGNVASWTAMIVAYIQSGECHSALQLFSTMDLEGARQHGKAIHSAIFEAGIDTSGALGIALVKMYERCGSVTESTKLFKEMPERSPHRLIAGLHCQQMDEKEVEEMFQAMDLEGRSLDREAAIATISACWQSSIARTIHARVLESEWSLDSNLAAALINMHGKCGNLREARRVFDELGSGRDSVLWTSIMAAYSRDSGAKSCQEIFELFGMMSLEGVAPSGVSFIIVLTTCSHTGMLGRAVECVRWMIQDFGMEAGGYHLACVVDLLGRAGRGDDAAEVVNRMLVENRAALSLMYFDTLVDEKSLH